MESFFPQNPKGRDKAEVPPKSVPVEDAHGAAGSVPEADTTRGSAGSRGARSGTPVSMG